MNFARLPCYARFVLRNHGRQVWLGGKRVLVGDVRQRRQRQKPTHYNEAVVQELIKVWELLSYACGKRPVAIMPELIAKLEQFGELRGDSAAARAAGVFLARAGLG